ncbi:hypothetical protein [Salmonella enterica]|uniref:hypothetical protein n=1 Tax=Salmonella enterica TaxID=28901 RepID=UPI0015C48043|nr:hypothetical protein [Salmonella enterica]
MKYSWFHHHDCTTEQADTLVSDYQKRGIRTEKSLNPDFITWTVSAKLPEYAHRRNVRRNPFSAPLRKKNAPPGASGKPRLSR